MDFLTAAKNIAPFIVSTFGTPMAGLAVKALLNVVPEDIGKELQAAAEAPAATPAGGVVAKLGDLLAQGKIDVEQIKQAEREHQATMASLGYKHISDLAKIAADDRANARTAAVQGGIQKHLLLLSIILLVTCLGSEVYILFNGYPKELPEMVVGRVLGLLDAITLMVCTFYYGTTARSGAKDDTIATLAGK